jgi:lipid A 4'-phosphatase
MRRSVVYAALVVATTALFLLLPQVDLSVSGWFYDSQHGFALNRWAPVSVIYHVVPWISWAIALLVSVASAWLFFMQRPLARLDRKAVLFIVISTLLGPGLLANAVLKDHWGRARPTQVEAFGGNRHFTAAPLPAVECARNCSFVSGHAALGFSLVAFAFLQPPGKARQRAIAAALGFGAFIGIVRIAQGGHFLSDVVWAGLLVFGTTAVIHWAIVEKDVFAAPGALRVYTFARRTAHSALRWLWATHTRRTVTAGVFTAVLVVTSISWVDRPVALYLHSEDPALRGLFAVIGSLGEAWGWLVVLAGVFAALHWGGGLPRLHEAAAAMRTWSAIPAFLFASIAVAGLTADVMKIGLGRVRPKLLFGSDLYGFTGLAWRPDHWSFPSGHAATIVALTTALWWLWPQHLLFYILAAAIVAASRIVVGAHYPSDVIAGAFVAVLATRSVVWIFARWDIDLAAVGRKNSGLSDVTPWPCRCFRQLSIGRRGRAAVTPGQPLASASTRVVSRRHGVKDRDI